MLHRLLLRFKLNSIGYGPKILGIVGLLMAGVPLGLSGIHAVLGLWGIDAGAILTLMKVSLGVGGLLLGIFVVAMAVEFAQDRYLDAHYHKNQWRKVKLPDEYYECQYCGHRRVRQADRSCPVCGKTFARPVRE